MQEREKRKDSPPQTASYIWGFFELVELANLAGRDSSQQCPLLHKTDPYVTENMSARDKPQMCVKPKGVNFFVDMAQHDRACDFF